MKVLAIAAIALITAIPVILLTWMGVEELKGPYFLAPAFGFFFAGALWLIEIAIAAIFTMKGKSKRTIAAGMWIGLGIGIIPLAVILVPIMMA